MNISSVNSFTVRTQDRATFAGIVRAKFFTLSRSLNQLQKLLCKKHCSCNTTDLTLFMLRSRSFALVLLLITPLWLFDMSSYCVVTSGGKTFEGSKAEIVVSLLSPRFDEKRRLRYQFAGCKEVIAHSYGNDFSDLEAASDAVNYLWGQLKHFKCRTYKLC